MQKTRRKYHKKIFEWIKESKEEHVVNICELNRSCRRWMHSGRNITYECFVSQSVLYEVLNTVPDDVVKIKCLFNGEIMFHSAFKKDTEKVVLLN